MMTDGRGDPWIPVSQPSITELEERYAADAVRSTWISSNGPYIERFEREFAARADTRAAVAMVNGTSALHVALVVLGVGPGDQVIVPSLTYIATANAVRYTGATPVFVDVDPATWCLDPERVREAVTSTTRGIIPVHLYGHPADMDPLNAIAHEHGLWVLEDAAEAHGAKYRGRLVGGLGTIGAFSFYGNKIITSGEGGALTVNDFTLESRVRLLRGQGMDPERRYWFPEVGYNYRMTNVAAALACAQLERFDEMAQRRRAIFAQYHASLSTIEGIGFQPVATWADPAPWLFCVTVDEHRFGATRDELARRLREASIDTRPFFIPVHRLPPYDLGHRASLPVTDGLAHRGLNLPTYVDMTTAEIDRVAAAVSGVCASAA